MDYDAKLKNWATVQITNKEFIVYGQIFDDKKGRFEDGATVKTSGVKNQQAKQGSVIKTRNTKYLLCEPAIGDEFPV